uniref:Ovule protein n=1 Tax=Romanomermis culicivorax TaxID=13658 RepID=A0A915HFS5_ROMCU
MHPGREKHTIPTLASSFDLEIIYSLSVCLHYFIHVPLKSGTSDAPSNDVFKCPKYFSISSTLTSALDLLILLANLCDNAFS